MAKVLERNLGVSLDMTARTGFVVIDAVIVAAVALQGISLGLRPDTTQAINSVALLGLAIIGVWTAHKTAAIKDKTDEIKKVADATHTLSNSAMGAQLKMNVQFATSDAVSKHRIATLTNEAGDIAAAQAADIVVKEQEDLLQRHVIAQAKVDGAAQ